MSYLVTGGTGFLGQHLVRRLVDDNLQDTTPRVRVLSRDLPPQASRVPGVEYIQGSVLDKPLLAEASEGMTGVFHLAGLVEHSRRAAQRLHQVNVVGTTNVVEAAAGAGVARVVYASTSGVSAVSAKPGRLPDDSAGYAEELTSRWPYYASKIEAERQARHMAERLGVQLVCMRPSLLLGPGDARLSSCRSVWDLLRGAVPFVPSGGVSFVDVRDAADAFAQAMALGRAGGGSGGTYLLGAANVPCAEYFAMVEAASGVKGPRLRLPGGVAWALAWALWRAKGVFGIWDPSLDPVLVEMAQAWWYLDASAAAEDLEFSPRDPRQTVADTVDWLQHHYNSGGDGEKPQLR